MRLGASLGQRSALGAGSQHPIAPIPVLQTALQPLRPGRSCRPVLAPPLQVSTVKQSATSTSPRTPSSPATPVVSVWHDPSGQPGSAFHTPPLTGKADPLGASIQPSAGGVNFAIYTSSAYSVSLVLFTEQDLNAGRVTHEIPLDPERNRTGDVWHILLPKLRDDLVYGYRVQGLHQDLDEESPGHRHDETKVVLDPYATAVLSRRRWGQLGPDLNYGDAGVLGLANTWPQAAGALPSWNPYEFDWEGDRPLALPMEQLVIYEMHVRGFTQHASSNVSSPGTYAGLIQKLDYLKALGVNAIELMPIFEFNELEYYSLIPGSTNSYRYNFWGYSTVGFFAPMSRFSASVAAGGHIRSAQNEFKALVKECHKRGIEVILDVVFNHTAEGNDKGPTISFRGLDNRTYYMLAPGGEYYNYSGCGNTLNCNQPAVRKFILDCLRHWVTEYHVDGFRFDLASILTRAHSAWHPDEFDEEGNRVMLHSGGAVVNDLGIMTDGAGVPTGTPLSDPALVEAISEDPVLRDTKMIAEAWDCDGLNQVGAFPHYGGRWAEWNGRFRDVVRNFVKGTDGLWAGDFASCICGSPNLYANNNPPETDWWANNGGRKWRGNRGPTASINFVTAHDGFTLADVVAYNNKHNEANGEDNRDGENHNNSWNCGHEGPTDRWEVNRLRQRQMRNMAAALLMAHGVPMLYMGDEYGHTKHGNNNTYCHDSDVNYFRWDEAAKDPAGFARFMRLLIHFRRSRPELQRSTFVNDRDVQWHGELPNQPDWSETSRLVAFTMPNHLEGGGLYVAFNTSHQAKVLTLPRWGGRVWKPLVDTSKVAPYDFLVADGVLTQEDVESACAAQAVWIADHSYPVLPWSCIVLESIPEDPLKTLAHKETGSFTAATLGSFRTPADWAPLTQAMQSRAGFVPQGGNGHHGHNHGHDNQHASHNSQSDNRNNSRNQQQQPSQKQQQQLQQAQPQAMSRRSAPKRGSGLGNWRQQVEEHSNPAPAPAPAPVQAQAPPRVPHEDAGGPGKEDEVRAVAAELEKLARENLLLRKRLKTVKTGSQR